MKNKKIMVLVISLILYLLVTKIAGYFLHTDNLTLRTAVVIFFNILLGCIAITFIKISNMELNINLKNKKQYLIGVLIAIFLGIIMALLTIIFKIQSHVEFSWPKLISQFLIYIIIVGPAEELMFRVYVQDTLISCFSKKKYLGVIIASILFGLIHIINGSYIQVVFASLIGLVFGLSKYLVKDCTYLSLSLGHGLYDFMNLLIRMFII